MKPHNDYYRPSPEKLESLLAEIGQADPTLGETACLTLAAAAAAQESAEVCRTVFRAVLSQGADPAAVREAVLQTHLFAGYPRAINALAELAGLTAFTPAPIDPDLDLGRDREFRERGERLCREVYGKGYEKLLEVMGRISPELGRWMLVDGYGKVLGRPELPARVRELCAAAALVVLHVPPQLRAHIRGCFLTGSGAAEVSTALRMGWTLRPDQRELAQRTLQEMAARSS